MRDSELQEIRKELERLHDRVRALEEKLEKLEENNREIPIPPIIPTVFRY